MIPALIVFAWLLCPVLSYGLAFASFQREYPDLVRSWYERDRRAALKCAAAALIIGPYALAIVLGFCGFGRYGLKFR